jgi:chemotaxis signal transduction protein
MPQTKKWLRGLVNAKGVLHSVTDLSLFAGYDRPIKAEKGHLLLLNERSRQCALLVSRVIGFRYFDEQAIQPGFQSNSDLPEGLSSFVVQCYRVENQYWYQIDIEEMIDSEQFREVQ